MATLVASASGRCRYLTPNLIRLEIHRGSQTGLLSLVVMRDMCVSMIPIILNLSTCCPGSSRYENLILPVSICQTQNIRWATHEAKERFVYGDDPDYTHASNNIVEAGFSLFFSLRRVFLQYPRRNFRKTKGVRPSTLIIRKVEKVAPCCRPYHFLQVILYVSMA